MSVVVVGAGVVGLACAYELSQDGHDIVLLDAGTPGAAASHGNAAKVAIAESTPVPAPGMVLQGLKWMLRPDSPLYIKPTLSPRALRFMAQMARACTEAQFRRGLRVHLELASRCVDIFDEWTTQGLDFEMHERGVLLAFENESSYTARRRFDDVFSDFQVEAETLDADGVHRVEPALSHHIKHGLYYPRDRQIEPDSLTAALADRCRAMGVKIHADTPVTGFERGAAGVKAVLTEGTRYEADWVVLAAGVWTGPLSDRLGVPLPIRPGKGYSVDYLPTPIKLNTSLTFEDAHVAVTPLNGMVRLAGTMEFGGLDQGLNPRRIEAIKQAAVHGFTHWDPQAPHAKPWVGLRPMTPDGLPIVGQLPPVPNAIVASGHGMLGLTLAPTTGRMVRDLIAEGPVARPVDDILPDRFLRRSRTKRVHSETMGPR